MACIVLISNLGDAFTAGPSLSAKSTMGSSVTSSRPVSSATSRPAASQASSLLGFAAPSALLCLVAAAIRQKPAKSFKLRVKAVPCKAFAVASQVAPAMPPVVEIFEAAPTLAPVAVAIQETPLQREDLIASATFEAASPALTTPIATASSPGKSAPKAARFAGSARCKAHNRAARAACRASSRSARRAVGQRLQARASVAPVAARVFDSSRIRRHIQLGLRTSASPKSESGRESSPLATVDASDVSTGLHIQEVNPRSTSGYY